MTAMTGWFARLPVLPELLARRGARPDVVDPDDQWAEEFICWVREMRSMEGTRCLRRPLPHPVSRSRATG